MSEGRITGLDSMILIPPTLALLAQVAMLKTFGMHLLEVEQEEEQEMHLDSGAPWIMFGQALFSTLASMMAET